MAYIKDILLDYHIEYKYKFITQLLTTNHKRMKKVLIDLPEKMVSVVDLLKGDQSRSYWIKNILQNRIEDNTESLLNEVRTNNKDKYNFIKKLLNTKK